MRLFGKIHENPGNYSFWVYGALQIESSETQNYKHVPWEKDIWRLKKFKIQPQKAWGLAHSFGTEHGPRFENNMMRTEHVGKVKVPWVSFSQCKESSRCPFWKIENIADCACYPRSGCSSDFCSHYWIMNFKFTQIVNCGGDISSAL